MIQIVASYTKIHTVRPPLERHSRAEKNLTMPKIVLLWLLSKTIVNVSYYGGLGTGLAGPTTARPKFPEPTIKNIIPLFVIKQIGNFCITVESLYHLTKELYYYIIKRTRH